MADCTIKLFAGAECFEAVPDRCEQCHVRRLRNGTLQRPRVNPPNHSVWAPGNDKAQVDSQRKSRESFARRTRANRIESFGSLTRTVQEPRGSRTRTARRPASLRARKKVSARVGESALFLASISEGSFFNPSVKDRSRKDNDQARRASVRTPFGSDQRTNALAQPGSQGPPAPRTSSRRKRARTSASCPHRAPLERGALGRVKRAVDAWHSTGAAVSCGSVRANSASKKAMSMQSLLARAWSSVLSGQPQPSRDPTIRFDTQRDREQHPPITPFGPRSGSLARPNFRR